MIPDIPKLCGEKILALFQWLPAGTEIVLFGSRAMGNFREGSDIDIAIRNEAVTLAQRDALLAQYEELYLPWKLDLVVYHLIDTPAFREHIDRVGVTLLRVGSTE